MNSFRPLFPRIIYFAPRPVYRRARDDFEIESGERARYQFAITILNFDPYRQRARIGIERIRGMSHLTKERSAGEPGYRDPGPACRLQ